MTERPHVCIVVQNLPVPFDRRVWLESQALRDHGYEVSVVCPKGPADPTYEVLDEVHLYRYKPFPPITRQIFFVGEYLYSILFSFLLLAKVWRRRRFVAVQLCNPPDVLWAAAAPFRYLRGVKVVFDQHDLCPELYESRFPEGPSVVYKALRATEWLTYRCAHRVISMNDSYRSVALARGGKRLHHVQIVRTGPNPAKMRRAEVHPPSRRGREHLIAYIGVMGPQDGVDYALRAMAHIVYSRGRTDVAMTLIGDGDARPDLVRLAEALKLGEYVYFTGRIPDAEVSQILSTAEVGLSPDPRNPLNDVSTMNKTMEYMAYEIPVVAFDLIETKVSAQASALYATPNDPVEYGDLVLELLDDEPRRAAMGAAGRQRVEEHLAWSVQVPGYLAMYDELTGRQ